MAQGINETPVGDHQQVPAARLVHPDARRLGAAGVVLRAARWFRDHLSALLKYATNHAIARVPCAPLRRAWYRCVLGWQMGPSAAVQLNVRIIANGLLSGRGRVCLGEGAVIEEGTVLQPFAHIRLGARARVGPGAFLLTGGHDIDHPKFALVTAPITIEDDALIGPRAIVLGGVTVGRGAIVAPGAIVTKDVPPFAIVAGLPAQVIRMRTLEELGCRLSFQALFEPRPQPLPQPLPQ